MTTPALSLTAHDGYLSEVEINSHLRVIQADPCVEVTSEDGEDRLVYRSTPESEAAQEILVTAFLPLIHKAARASLVLDYDDAVMVALEEFLSVARRYETGSALPFTAGLRTILSRKLGDVGRTSGLISVKENSAARYRQLMDAVDWDLNAAYALVRTGHEDGTGTNKGFTPDTFLSVHRAIGVESLDGAPSLGDDNQHAGLLDTSGRMERHLGDATPSPEDETVQAETVRWLFGLVPTRQSEILRLRFGFCDLATENVRLRHGYRTGEILSDRQVAQVVGSTTPTVNRQKNEALSTMRDALLEVEGE